MRELKEKEGAKVWGISLKLLICPLFNTKFPRCSLR